MQNYKKALVLLNMGGPNNINEVSVFLKNMFDDPCILSIKNNMFRSMIGSMIVNSRVEKSKKIYEALGGYSPITEITFALTKKLQERNKDIFYTYAMRYVPPYATSVVQEIMQKNINDIILFSMYPQYSSTTTYSSFQDIANAIKSLDFYPKITTIDRYSSNDLFIRAITKTIINTLSNDNAQKFVLILSSHSIPVSRVRDGDPYQKECEETLKLLKQELESNNINFKDIILSYQSKIGPVKWIGPYTCDVIKQNSKDNIIIYPLSFTIDNSETKYELCIQYKELADKLGIKDYRVCSCLNYSDEFVELIEHLAT